MHQFDCKLAVSYHGYAVGSSASGGRVLLYAKRCRDQLRVEIFRHLLQLALGDAPNHTVTNGISFLQTIQRA